MTRSNRKKNHKRVKKLIKKLKDECCLAKKHYGEKINELEMELWNKRYYITSILGYLASISYNPWNRAVYRGFVNMCDDEWKTCTFFFLTKKVTKNPYVTLLQIFFQLFSVEKRNIILIFFYPVWDIKTVHRGYQKLWYGKSKNMIFLFFLTSLFF